MKAFLLIAVPVSIALGALAAASCSTDYCGSMAGFLACPDPVIQALGQRIVDEGNQDECRLYGAAFIYTYQPVCLNYGRDAGNWDSGYWDTGIDSGPPNVQFPEESYD
jgi:hypothetical protein